MPHADSNDVGATVSRNPSVRQMEKAPELEGRGQVSAQVLSLDEGETNLAGPGPISTSSKFKETI